MQPTLLLVLGYLLLIDGVFHVCFMHIVYEVGWTGSDSNFKLVTLLFICVVVQNWHSQFQCNIESWESPRNLMMTSIVTITLLYTAGKLLH